TRRSCAPWCLAARGRSPSDATRPAAANAVGTRPATACAPCCMARSMLSSGVEHNPTGMHCSSRDTPACSARCPLPLPGSIEHRQVLVRLVKARHGLPRRLLADAPALLALDERHACVEADRDVDAAHGVPGERHARVVALRDLLQRRATQPV